MKKKYQNLFFLFGLAVLIVMVTQLDFKQVWQGISHAGYWFFAVVVLWFFLYMFNTAAWYIIIKNTGKIQNSKSKIQNYDYQEDAKAQQTIGNQKPLLGGGLVGTPCIPFWGTSFVCGPQGEILYQSPEDKEDVYIVDVDMKRCEQVRRWWPFLRDRRIDNYGGITKRFID